MELPTNCWDRVAPKSAKRPEEITDARRAELEASERLLQALKPSLSSESQPEPLEFDQLDEDVEYRAFFLRCYGTGWKRGYYGDPDQPAICPFSDPEEREIWEQGICDGFDTYELLEGIPLRAQREKQRERYLQKKLKTEAA